MPAPGALTAPPIVLLTLEYAGRTWRHSSRPVDILDGSDLHHYRGGLAASDVYMEAPLLSVAESATMPVDVLVETDLAALVAQGHSLAEMRGEIALYREGDTLGQRMVLVSGAAEVESGGYLGRPLRLSIVGDSPVSRPGVWPPPKQTFNAETWGGNYDPENEGVAYPQVLGQAGYIRVAGTPSSVAAIPAYSVHYNTSAWFARHTPFGDSAAWQPAGAWPPPTGPAATFVGYYLLLSAGWMYPGDVGSAQRGYLRVAGDVGGDLEWADACLVYAVDQIGQIVTLARVTSGPSWWPAEPGRSYYAAVTPPCSGIARRDWRGGLDGAGEISRWSLEQSSIRVDWRRTGAALPRLDRYRVGAFWDQRIDAWGWVGDNVLPLLPVTWVPGPLGLYPVAWRLEATADDADLELTDDDGIDCTIEGEPKQEGTDEIRSRRTLDYAHSLHSQAYMQRVTAHGSPTRETTSETIMPDLRRTQQRLGSARGAQTLALDEAESTDIVYDDSTAWMSAGWRGRVYSGPRTTYRLVAPHYSRLARVEPGMVLALTSSRYSLARRVMHVTRAGWLGGMCYAEAVALSEVR